MKLLYLMNKINGRGGLNRIAFEKINYLVTHGFSVDVIYFGTPLDKPFYQVDDSINFYCLQVNPLLPFSKKLLSIITVCKSYTRYVKKLKPDIIVNMNTNILSWIVPFYNRKVPKIIELHQSYDGVRIFNEENYGKGSFKDLFSMWLRKTVYPLYETVVVLTNTDKEKWKLSNVIVIPNYTQMQKRITPNYQSKIFIWVGRLSHQKGIDILLKIWDSFIKLEPDARLILIGKSNDRYQCLVNEYLQTEIGRKTIEYVSETNRMIDYYSRASVYISTSRYEGLPLCLIEASTLGLPIIGFDISGNDEVVKNGINGKLINFDDINAFIKFMQELINNNVLKEQYGTASIKEAAKFKKEEIMQKWIQLFNSYKK